LFSLSFKNSPNLGDPPHFVNVNDVIEHKIDACPVKFYFGIATNYTANT
jgi:hypothetical protein